MSERWCCLEIHCNCASVDWLDILDRVGPDEAGLGMVALDTVAPDMVVVVLGMVVVVPDIGDQDNTAALEVTNTAALLVSRRLSRETNQQVSTALWNIRLTVKSSTTLHIPATALCAQNEER